MTTVALLVTNLAQDRLGHPSHLADSLFGQSVLQHTAQRAAAIDRVEKIILIHPPGQDPLALINIDALRKPVVAFAHPDAAGDAFTPRIRAARKWSLRSWRGGLASATAWDELLPAHLLVEAMDVHHATAAVLVGGDWCLFDPTLADALLDIHLPAPDAMKLAITQAPPGLSPLVTSRDTLADLAKNHATLGNALAYNPRRPAIDPIGREVNHPIPASVRDTARRFIYDTAAPAPRNGNALIQNLADHLGDDLFTADAVAITDAARQLEADRPDAVFESLPENLTLELTTRRIAQGPVTPHHHLDLPEQDLPLETALRIAEQSAGRCLSLAGLGDPLLHPDWPRIIQAAHAAGATGLHVETDLLAEDPETLRPLIDLPLDLITVRLNADSAAVYEKVMGLDAFTRVMANLQWLFDQRAKQTARLGVPWIVPRFIKTKDNLADMERFFDRWLLVSGQAIIDRPITAGRGDLALLPDLSPVPMDPPWREPNPLQTKRNLTIRASGHATLCQHDYLARAPLGIAATTDLLTLWQNTPTLNLAPYSPDHTPMCRQCHDYATLYQQALTTL